MGKAIRVTKCSWCKSKGTHTFRSPFGLELACFRHAWQWGAPPYWAVGRAFSPRLFRTSTLRESPTSWSPWMARECEEAMADYARLMAGCLPSTWRQERQEALERRARLMDGVQSSEGG